MAQSPTVGWGIVGCGRVADRRIAPVFAKTEDAALSAFCSRDLSKARAYCDRHGGRRAYGSLDDLLADDDVQIVYLATPNALHAEQASRCLAAGKHVLVDKPLATDAQAASSMVEAARTNGRLLGVMHQQRFHPANVHLIRLHDEGRLGKLNVLRVLLGMWYPLGPGESRTDPLRAEAPLPDPARHGPAPDNWRATPRLSGGGVVIDLAPHALDLMLEVGGRIERVSAQTRNLQFSAPVEDFCSARLEFASGALGLVDLSYCAHHYGGRVEAYGSEATFAADGSMQTAGVYCTWFRHGNTAEPMQQEVSTI
ncbi:MAG: Gfo/Idh/MocA family oxidoreductase, partial [Dehalococcoidia bacterium]